MVACLSDKLKARSAVDHLISKLDHCTGSGDQSGMIAASPKKNPRPGDSSKTEVVTDDSAFTPEAEAVKELLLQVRKIFKLEKK